MVSSISRPDKQAGDKRDLPLRSAIQHSRQRRLTQRGVLWLGLRCDLKCKFCYDDRLSDKDKIWLEYQDATRALHKFQEFYGNRFVDFMGGEPTLHPNILKILHYAADIGLRPTIVTHGLHLTDQARVQAYAEAGLHDCLVSIHGVGETAASVHGSRRDNFARQVQALRNLRQLEIPVRFNCIMIRDNLSDLHAVADLAVEHGARVVNFLTFNPYFEWSKDEGIPFQVRHSEAAEYLTPAIDRCNEAGVEVNVRYMPLCQLPKRASHLYTGFQLPYDTHEWDYNSWYDAQHEGPPSPDWYLAASRRQQLRHRYVQVEACSQCALRHVCDGFHSQYVARFGGEEAAPFPGPLVRDPCHFINGQVKIEYPEPVESVGSGDRSASVARLASSQFRPSSKHRAGVRPEAGPGKEGA
jgi:MoaA/NifB/PqqE/SkfB family radical SAM enzyme